MSKSIEEILRSRPVDRAKINAEKARLLELIDQQQAQTEFKEKD